jgi:hypothetical protein
MRLAHALLCGLLVLSCHPFAQQPARITREPEATFRPLVGSDALALIERSVAATYAVAYAVRGDLEGTMVSGSWTTFQRPPLVRLDMAVTGRGTRVDFRSYVSPAGVIVCEMSAPPRCQEAAAAAGPDASASNALARRPDDYTVVSREKLRLADEETQCFLFRPRSGVTGTFKEAFICYALDGVPLMVEMDLEDGSRFALEGRIAKRAVSDEELRPPARTGP